MQFDVYANPDKTIFELEPYVVDLQHDHLSVLRSVVVAPLLNLSSAPPISRLTPIIAFDNQQFVLKIYDLAAYLRPSLRDPLGSIAAYREKIISAIDVLFTGV